MFEARSVFIACIRNTQTLRLCGVVPRKVQTTLGPLPCTVAFLFSLFSVNADSCSGPYLTVGSNAPVFTERTLAKMPFWLEAVLKCEF